MTIVEVVVAAMLLVMAATATLGIVDTSTRSTYRAEETQTVINVAQREIERLRDLSYPQIAMTSVPPATTDANLPTSRIRGGGDFCLERVDGDDPCTAVPLVANGGQLENGGGTVTGGAVQPLTEDVEVGDITMDIYRFVVWQDEGDELLSPTSEFCQDKPLHFRCKAQDYKRVVVAVRAQEAPISHQRPYEEVQSDFADPDRATLDAKPLGPGEGDVVTGQQFWLSDTRCQTGTTEPPRIPAASHETHDTLGTCASAEQAPDALLTGPPDDPDPADVNVPGFFDLSTEIEPSCPDPPPHPLPGGWPVDCYPDDSGLQMLDQAGSCSAAPAGEDALRKIHRWVSTPMPTGFQFEMTDRATLELWTRTIDGVQGASGHVCGFLFKRSAGDVDTILASASYVDPDWPSGPPWEEVRLTFDLDNLTDSQRTVVAGERLGVSIGVDPSGTPDNVLQFLYDHPEGESRLEVLTTTPLP
jgi:hypothetical protein